jgi:hypothetical protein
MQLTMHLARKINFNTMGKKLTSWEKAARERELEREREKRANVVERKRVAYRKAKQSELKEQIESSKERVEAWETLYENIINLPKRTFEVFKNKSTLFENLGKNIPTKVPAFTRTIEIIPIENVYNIKSFKSSNNINILKSETKLTIEEYANKYNKLYISWLDFIFKTKQSFNNHILNKEAELEKEITQDEKKKAEFINFLNEYKKLIDLENHEFKLTVDKDEKVIKEDYESFSLELGKIIENKITNLKLIKKEFSDFEKPVFYQVLLRLLPIDFDLKPQKYLTNNPSKLKVGISKVTQSEASIYIQITQESFPIDDIQLVMLKERHSEKPLTKIQVKEIEQNYYSGLLLSYSYYIFKYTELENLQVRVVKNMPDPATGNNILNLIQGIKTSKSEFEKINISKIIPFEAMKKLSNLSYLPSEEVIYWSGRSYFNFYSIEKDVMDALLSDDEIDFPEDFKGVKKIKTPMSEKLQALAYKLSKYVSIKNDAEHSSRNVKGKENNKQIPIIKKMSELDRASREIEDMLKEYE